MKWIIGFVAGFIVLILSMSLFLAPDSLLECSESPSATKDCHRADAIVAVSGGDTSARTQVAIDLYQQGWAPKVIFSGAAYDKSGPSNASVMRTQALRQGVPAADILVEEDSATTRENAQNTSQLLASMQASDVIIVSSSYHMKRTLIEFRREAPDVAFRAHPTNSDNQWSVWWWTTPQGWYLAVSEIIKIVVVYTGESQ